MISKSVVLGLLAAGCMTAAAGGAYVAVRQNASPEAARDNVVATPSAQPVPAASQPVAETEAVITPAKPERTEPAPAPSVAPRATPREAAAAKPTARRNDPTPRVDRAPAPAAGNRAPNSTPARETSSRPADAAVDPSLSVERPTASRDNASTTPAAAPITAPVAEPTAPEPPPAPPKPQFVEVVVPISSVVGLRVDTSLSSETSRVEDRVEARVTRDVMADGRVAIPAGTRALGDVVLVDRGGKMKDKARLGVRFHTLVLANGNHVPLRTDAIYREGSSPGAESARKIGGAAAGGAILGAIIGGAKGAAIGAAAGGAGGSAVVMAGDRNAATLPAGTVLSVRLNSPISVDIEREN
jgi:hypothetical protein